MALFASIFTREKKPVRNAEEGKRVSREYVPVETPSVADQVGAARTPLAASFVLIRPHTTEKTALLANTGVYVFVVDRDANKHTVASAVEARYRVKVERVRMSRTHEKMRRRGRQVGWKPGVRKAIVQLVAGNKIETL